MVFETLKVSKEGPVLFVEIAAPPMNLLGPELVRDLVSLIQRAEADEAVIESGPFAVASAFGNGSLPTQPSRSSQPP